MYHRAFLSLIFNFSFSIFNYPHDVSQSVSDVVQQRLYLLRRAVEVGHHDRFAACRVSRAYPVRRVLEGYALFWPQTEEARGLYIDIGRRLAVLDLLRACYRVEIFQQSDALEVLLGEGLRGCRRECDLYSLFF